MAKPCTRDEQCAVPAIAKACPSVPMTFACERGHCRSHRTDGCDPPYELDADAMRRVIVNCVQP
jgi:hypothetical protein